MVFRWLVTFVILIAAGGFAVMIVDYGNPMGVGLVVASLVILALGMVWST